MTLKDKPIDKDSAYIESVISIDRVARVVKGGRRFRFRALVVVGDGANGVGIGIAKGADVTIAVAKATDVAKKKLIKVPVSDGTLAHEVYAKLGGAKIFIKPASPGTGLIAGGVVRSILEAAGIKNALSKSLGSSNKINMAYATLEALVSVTPKEKWHTSIQKITSRTVEKHLKIDDFKKPEVKIKKSGAKKK